MAQGRRRQKSWRTSQPPARPAAPVRRSLRRSSESTNPLGGYIGQKVVGLVAGMIVGGVVVAYMGYKDSKQASLALPTAQKMTLEELATNGPGSNAHVELSEFSGTLEYAYEGRKLTASVDVWETVLIPLVPRGGAYDQMMAELNDGEEAPTPKDFNVVLKSTTVSSEGSLERLLSKDTLRGLVINEIDPISSSQRELLRETFPDAKISSCWIFHEGRVPPEKSRKTMWIGILMFVAGTCGAIAWYVARERAKARHAEVHASRLARRQRLMRE